MASAIVRRAISTIASDAILYGDSVGLGDHCVVASQAVIGGDPQDLKYRGEKSSVIIGSHCKIGGKVTVNKGTTGGGLSTVIGSHCELKYMSHVGHDCTLGDRVVVGDYSCLAGHVILDDNVRVGERVGILQRVHVGKGAAVLARCALDCDLVPFGVAQGNRAYLKGFVSGALSPEEEQILLDLLLPPLPVPLPLSLKERAMQEKQQHARRPSNFADVLQFIIDKTTKGRPLCLPRPPSP